uniref:Uncharacterized protein n=1 Tax=Amazona collaria TaxID=241587 RepID=A0A8B9F7S9_9PSIT
MWCVPRLEAPRATPRRPLRVSGTIQSRAERLPLPAGPGSALPLSSTPILRGSASSGAQRTGAAMRRTSPSRGGGSVRLPHGRAASPLPPGARRPRPLLWNHFGACHRAKLGPSGVPPLPLGAPAPSSRLTKSYLLFFNYFIIFRGSTRLPTADWAEYKKNPTRFLA